MDKIHKTRLQEHFEICANDLNYEGCMIKGMWYQQYVKNNTHGVMAIIIQAFIT